MILDFSQAEAVRSLRQTCDAYCMTLQRSDSCPLQTFPEWLSGNNAVDAAKLLAQWSWLCGIMGQSETNRMTGLAELLALGFAMDHYENTEQPALSGKDLKQTVHALARAHSQLCVLQHAEKLLTPANKDRILDALWKLFQVNAGGKGSLISCEPAKNIFNHVCKECQTLRQQKQPLLLNPNQTSYSRILLDAYAEVQQFLQEKKAQVLTAELEKTTPQVPQAMATQISARNKRNPYAAAEVIWQALENSPAHQNLVRGYQVLRHGVVASHASLPVQMTQFGQPGLSKDPLPGSSGFFRYAVYDESSPALYVVRQTASSEKLLSFDFLAAPDNGELFSLYTGLFFELYSWFAKMPAKLGYAPLASDTQGKDLLDFGAAFSGLWAEFPEQASNAGSTGAAFSEFVCFLEEFAGTADGRNLLAEILAVDSAKKKRVLDFKNLTFKNLQQATHPEPGTLAEHSVWDWFVLYQNACQGSHLLWKAYRKSVLLPNEPSAPEKPAKKAGSRGKSKNNR